MKTLQIWFIIVAGLLGLGIPFLFIGAALPSAMRTAVLAEAAEYVILDEEDANFWAEIPGRMKFRDQRQFYVYNCTNPEDVAIRGTKPNFVEVGPFPYDYSHVLDERVYESEGNAKNNRVSFVRRFIHKYSNNAERDPLNNELRAVNVAGLKRWANAKAKPRFHMALEGFFELFYFARNNMPRDLVTKDFYQNWVIHGDNVRNLVQGLESVSDAARRALTIDHSYGLFLIQNVYEWSFMCDSIEPYIEHEIMTYFNISVEDFEVVRHRYCTAYIMYHDKFINNSCAKLHTECNNYNITFYQWLNNSILPKSYKDLTFKWIGGIFEFAQFVPEFMKRLKDEYKAQFANVKWNDKPYDYLLDTFYEPPDYRTDNASMLLFENMKSLFEAGKRTDNPYKSSLTGAGAAPLDLSRFDQIANVLRLSNEQAFMMYCYFDYFVNNTILLTQYKGTVEKERIANYASYSFRDLADYCMDYLDIVIYSRVFAAQNPSRNCSDQVKYYFTINETEAIMPELINAICDNIEFNTNITKPLGWKYFLEAAAFPYYYHYFKLYYYFQRAIPHFDTSTLALMLYAKHSPFAETLFHIKDAVKKHYNSKSPAACDGNEFSHMCTKKQIFIAQFRDSAITKNPYPPANLPATNNIGDWWTIIRPYIDYTFSGRRIRAGDGLPWVLDREIEAPVEFPFLIAQYGPTPITKQNLFNTFHALGMYDTDMVYALFLGLLDFNDKHRDFANFRGSFFYNATRYILRNVQFGPMFDRLLPEEVYFGYKNLYLEAEHLDLDYLRGDDCTLNPWIGYNAHSSDEDEKTFKHLRLRNTFRTGSDSNAVIRQYSKYLGSDSVIYSKLFMDTTGDQCDFETALPFIRPAFLGVATDGLQFDQFGGKSPQGDQMDVLDSITQRPMKITRKTNYDYEYNGLEVNNYALEFENTYLCEGGTYITNAVDMTSFFQLKSIISRPRLVDIKEPMLVLPNVLYTHPLEKDRVPYGLNMFDSYYEVEPYTGITFGYTKKMMTSFLLYYDELYDRVIPNTMGEIIPYYAMYERANVSDSWAQQMIDDINSGKKSRQRLSVSFVIIGVLFLLSGIGMIVAALFFEPSNVDETPALDQPKKDGSPFLPDTSKEPLIPRTEDLQPEVKELNPPLVLVLPIFRSFGSFYAALESCPLLLRISHLKEDAQTCCRGTLSSFVRHSARQQTPRNVLARRNDLCPKSCSSPPPAPVMATVQPTGTLPTLPTLPPIPAQQLGGTTGAALEANTQTPGPPTLLMPNLPQVPLIPTAVPVQETKANP